MRPTFGETRRRRSRRTCSDTRRRSLRHAGAAGVRAAAARRAPVRRTSTRCARRSKPTGARAERLFSRLSRVAWTPATFEFHDLGAARRRSWRHRPRRSPCRPRATPAATTPRRRRSAASAEAVGARLHVRDASLEPPSRCVVVDDRPAARRPVDGRTIAARALTRIACFASTTR